MLGFNMLGIATVPPPLENRSPRSFRAADYHNADIDAMNEAFRAVNWKELWALCDQDSSQYLELIKILLNQYSPVPRARSSTAAKDATRQREHRSMQA